MLKIINLKKKQIKKKKLNFQILVEWGKLPERDCSNYPRSQFSASELEKVEHRGDETTSHDIEGKKRRHYQRK